MQTIQQIVNDKVQSMIEDGSIKSVIETGVQKAIEYAISEQFGNYGSVTKSLNEAVKNGLMINTKDLPFETYNQQMLVAVKEKLGSLFQGAASEKFMAEIEKTLAPAPAQISVKDLVETIVKIWREDEFDTENLDYVAAVKLKEESWGSTLFMWKNKDSNSRYSKTEPNLKLFISHGSIRINHAHQYNPTCFNEHEAFIFKLYAAGTKITGLEEFDPDEYDLTLKEENDC